MENETERISISQFSDKGKSSIEDVVVRELPLTIILNDQELVTLLCSPTNLEYLTVGYLFSEGLLKSKGDIKRVLVDDKRGVVRVEAEGARELGGDVIFKRLITSGCGRGTSFYSAADVQNLAKIESKIEVLTNDVLSLVNEFQHRSLVHKETGGVHSAALCDSKNMLVFNEDIGRHNAIDKVFGECLLKDIATDDRLIVTSGRVSSEILFKVAKRNIPVLISKSAPTDIGVKLAKDLGVTLIGFARGKRMNVYANDWRVVSNG